MNFQNNGLLKIGVGGPSPYSAMADGATLDIGPAGLTLVISLSNPSKAELRAIRRGQLDIGMMMVGSTAVLLWRFKGKSSQEKVELESMFHIGLLPPDERRVPSGNAGRLHDVLIVLQDEHATCRGLRSISLSVDISDTIDIAVKIQAEEASQPGWSRCIHDAEVERYFRDFQSPTVAFAVTDALAEANELSASASKRRLA